MNVPRRVVPDIASVAQHGGFHTVLLVLACLVGEDCTQLAGERGCRRCCPVGGTDESLHRVVVHQPHICVAAGVVRANHPIGFPVVVLHLKGRMDFGNTLGFLIPVAVGGCNDHFTRFDLQLPVIDGDDIVFEHRQVLFP